MDENNNINTPETGKQNYSLNDDRRVKVLSPGALVMKRFWRNRLAVVGMSVLIFMFLFSFAGGIISPYGQNQFFYKDVEISREFAAVTENDEFRYRASDSTDKFGSAVQAQVMLAIQTKKADFTYRDIAYTVSEEGENFYSIYSGGELVGIAYKDIVSSSVEGKKLSFEFIFSALKAYTSDTSKGDSSFSADGTEYLISDLGYISDASGNEVAYISRYVVQAIMGDVFLSRDFKLIINKPVAENLGAGHRLQDQQIAGIHAPIRPIQDPADRIPAHAGDHDAVDLLRRAERKAVAAQKADLIRCACFLRVLTRGLQRALPDVRGIERPLIPAFCESDREISVVCTHVDHADPVRDLCGDTRQSFFHKDTHDRKAGTRPAFLSAFSAAFQELFQIVE